MKKINIRIKKSKISKKESFKALKNKLLHANIKNVILLAEMLFNLTKMLFNLFMVG